MTRWLVILRGRPAAEGVTIEAVSARAAWSAARERGLDVAGVRPASSGAPIRWESLDARPGEVT